MGVRDPNGLYPSNAGSKFIEQGSVTRSFPVFQNPQELANGSLADIKQHGVAIAHPQVLSRYIPVFAWNG